MKNRRKLAAACGGLLCLALSACSSGPAVQIPDVIQVENVNNGAEERSIVVSARETVKVTPDMAKIVCRLVTEHEDAKTCQEENGRQLDQVIQYLKEQGFQDNSIRTMDFSLDAQYDWSGNQRRLIGYMMTTRLEVGDVPVEQVGAILSGVVTAGANEIDSVSYFSSQYDEAYQEALASAMEMAQEKAEALAHAGGCQVTDVLSIKESGDDQNGRYVDSGVSRNSNFDAVKEAAAAAGADMAVMPGEMEVDADIQVEYLLLPQ